MTTQIQEGTGQERGTLVLTRQSIREAAGFSHHVAAVEEAFRRHGRGEVSLPEVVHIPAREGGFHVKSAAFTAEPHHVAVKVNGNFPGNPSRNGLPTIQGAVILCDGRNGFPLAILDSAEITARRTAAATAVAARYLALPESRFATIIGCGAQAGIQLEGILHDLPLEQIDVFDLDSRAAESFAGEWNARTRVAVRAVERFDESLRRSQVIVTCTTSRTPFLTDAMVPPGAFVAAVGADNPEKHELHPDLLAASRVVVDVLDQCAEIGDLHHALAAGAMSRQQVHAELGEIVCGNKRGRSAGEDRIIFDSTGCAFQDVAAAGMTYQRALEKGLGTPMTMA